MAYEGIGDLPSATEAYKSAISLDQYFIDAWINLGAVLQKAKKFQKSDEAFGQAIDLSPVYSRYRLSQIARNNGEIDKAIHHLKKALDIEPDNAAINDSLGIAYLLNEDFKKVLNSMSGVGGRTKNLERQTPKDLPENI